MLIEQLLITSSVCSGGQEARETGDPFGGCNNGVTPRWLIGIKLEYDIVCIRVILSQPATPARHPPLGQSTS